MSYLSTVTGEASCVHAWLFDDASTPITDHKGSANITKPSGMTLGQPGLLVGSATTAATVDGTNPATLPSAATLDNEFDINKNWSAEFLFNSTCARSGTAPQYSLLSNLKSSAPFDGLDIFLTYNNTSLTSRDGTAIPSTWMAVRAYQASDASNIHDSWATCNVPNSATTHVVVTNRANTSTTFVSDSFTDTAGTNLTAHTPGTGSTWTKHSGYIGDLVISNANRCRANSTATTILYYNAATPPSADYDVTVSCTSMATPTADQYPQVCGRIASGADTYYRAQLDYTASGHSLSLYKVVAGTLTAIAGPDTSFAPSVGTPFTITLSVNGTTIRASINGTQKLSTTDSSISAAGFAGIAMYTGNSADIGNAVGLQFNSFTAATVGAAVETRIYVNGNAIQMNYADTGTCAPYASGRVGALYGTIGLSTNFAGTVQSAVTYNAVLSEDQILQHYLAATNQVYNTSKYIYSAFKGVDTASATLKMSLPEFVWVAGESLWYCYSMDTTGTDVLAGGSSWDQSGINKVRVYTSPNLTAGSFTPAGTGGIALDASGSVGSDNVIRARVAFNSSSGKYVMWCHRYALGGTGNYLIAESSTPGGPFSIVDANYGPNGTSNNGDLDLYNEGANGYIIYDDNTSVFMSALDANWHATSGSRWTIKASVNQEGLTYFKRNGQYFLLLGPLEYYNSDLQTDLNYVTCSTINGTYSSLTSVYATNPLGTGYNSQATGCVVQLPHDTTRFIYFGDYWHNGYLSRSTVVVVELTFPTSTTLAMAPVKAVQMVATGGSYYYRMLAGAA